MIILPAIDILGGRCVRLYKGDYATSHEVAADPFDTAARFKADGASWVHMVDLDGARDGRRRNAGRKAACWSNLAAASGTWIPSTST
jgi:phosphoribosylformimino-5-aminoimidazole carboxamide ribotide isomerase